LPGNSCTTVTRNYNSPGHGENPKKASGGKSLGIAGVRGSGTVRFRRLARGLLNPHPSKRFPQNPRQNDGGVPPTNLRLPGWNPQPTTTRSKPRIGSSFPLSQPHGPHRAAGSLFCRPNFPTVLRRFPTSGLERVDLDVPVLAPLGVAHLPQADPAGVRV